MLLKENRAKSTRRAKGSPPKKSTTVEKGKMLTLGFKLAVAEGEDVKVDEGVDG
jgi:hypothetical protein